MNHQPFEDWLLEETSITPSQKRELDLHLRTCSYCSALVESGAALRFAKMAAPVEGFTSRFQARLMLHKLAERRRRFWGFLLFLTGGVGVLLAFAAPSILPIISSPESWIATMVSWGIFLLTTLQALTQAGEVFLHVLPGFVPPFAWMIIISMIAGLGLLWSVSIWRLTRFPQGV